MDLTAILRAQAHRYSCGVCQHNMADCGIHIIAQQGSRALVRVTCTACNDENVLQIIFQTEDELGGRIGGKHEMKQNALIDEGIPLVPDPISADDLLAVHTALAALNTGLTSLFAPSPPPLSDDAHAADET